MYILTLKSNIEDIDISKEIKNQLAEKGLKIKFHNTDFNYFKFNKLIIMCFWWTGFDTQTDDPNANFSYFKRVFLIIFIQLMTKIFTYC